MLFKKEPSNVEGIFLTFNCLNITIQRNPIRYNQKGSISLIVKAGKASCVLKILLEAVSMRSIDFLLSSEPKNGSSFYKEINSTDVGSLNNAMRKHDHRLKNVGHEYLFEIIQPQAIWVNIGIYKSSPDFPRHVFKALNLSNGPHILYICKSLYMNPEVEKYSKNDKLLRSYGRIKISIISV
uniref:FYR N-terminal domain-containing protein n=1 Tax=Strongyloides venezuelensis TaxID=75913 RepID=A0A0K0G5D5_STRVS